MTDNIHNPTHYTQGDIECIDAIRASMSKEQFSGFLKGNVMKYLWRYEHKGLAYDLQKMKVYSDWLILHEGDRWECRRDPDNNGYAIKRRA